MEHDLFRRLLSLGHDLLSKFFSLQGSGDIGQQLTLPDGEVLPRQPELHDRPYTTIFGDFTLSRTWAHSLAPRTDTKPVFPGKNLDFNCWRH